MSTLKIAAFVIAALMAVSVPVYAEGNGTSEESIVFVSIMDYSIPEEIGSMVGDARINIYDYDYNGLGSMIVENGKVVSGSNESLHGETHRFFVKNADTLQEVFDSDSFVKEFNRQRSLHNIRIEAIDFIDQLKLAIGTWVVSMMSFFIEG